MTLNQQTYKQIKKDVVSQTAYGVGFLEGIEEKIPAYALIDATREIALNRWIKPETTDSDIKNMLVTEAIKAMNYQDFKDVAPYLFSYPPEQKQQDLLVRPVQVTRDYFEELQANAQELFNLKRQINSEANKDTGIDELINQIEKEEVIQDTGLEVIAFTKDQGQFLILDNRSPGQQVPFLGDAFLENSLLINDYRSHLSDKAQILKAILENGSQEVKDYVYTFFNDNYREATGILEGLEEVANYYMADNMDVTLLDTVDSTALMWEMAQKSPTFIQDYSTLDELLDEFNNFDYMMDNAGQMIDYPEHLDYINSLLAKDNKAVMVKEIRGYSQGDLWTLGALYNPELLTAESVSYFLEHEAGAAYKGSLKQAYTITSSNLDEYGLEETLMLSENYIFDQELLWGNDVDAVKVLSQHFDLQEFVSIDAGFEAETTESTPKQEQELER